MAVNRGLPSRRRPAFPGGPRFIPEESVELGRWTCIGCGIQKKVTRVPDSGNEFPTVPSRKGASEKDFEAECRACRDKRHPGKGGNGDPPPWDPVWILADGAPADPDDQDDDDIDQIHHEGKEAVRRHKTRERDSRLRRRKIKEVKRRNGKLACQACDVEIEAVYRTPDGQVYECHHLVPLHVTGETVTLLSDVVLLCPTCHRAAHRTKPWPTLGQMRALHSQVTSGP